MVKYLVLYLKGFLMGTADLIPGVSGGTIALLVGIYEHLVDCIAATTSRSNLKLIQNARFGMYFRAIDATFLVTILLGLFSAIFGLARLIQYLLYEYPIAVDSFFFGLMIATVIVVAGKVSHWRLGNLIAVTLGTGLGLWLNFGTPSVGGDSYLWYFVSGVLAICAMILPGISGSFILILLGMYTRVLHLVVDLDFAHLSVFSLGALLGLLSFSRLLSWLFARFENLVLALLTGFILGAMVRLWPWKELANDATSYPLVLLSPSTYSAAHQQDAHIVLAALMALSGLALVLLVERFAHSKTTFTKA